MTKEFDTKQTDAALLGLTYMQTIAEKDNALRDLLHEQYKDNPLELMFAIISSYNHVLDLVAFKEGTSKSDYIHDLRREHLKWAALLAERPSV
jgi:hypothetical protein